MPRLEVLERKHTMQQAYEAITWGEGLAAVLTLGIITFLVLV
jgi:hypothetical protein